MYKLLIIFIAVTVICPIYGECQKVKSKFGVSDYHSEDNIYLQLDNSMYSCGDTVHFQGFILTNALPATITKNIYVDWFDENNRLFTHQIYPIVNGTTAGQWVVPNYYDGSSVRIIAYTKNIAQNNRSYSFHKNIPILEASPKPQCSVELFPEGGILVAGVENRVGFHMEGIPPTHIYLVNAQNDTLKTISTNGENYGSFVFLPKKENSYHITLPIGNIENIKLPPIQDSGIAIMTTAYSDSIIVRLHKTKGRFVDHLFLDGIMGEDTAFHSSLNLNNKDSLIIKIKLGDLPKGKMNIFLTNELGEILALRSIYISGNANDVKKDPLYILNKSLPNTKSKNLQLIYTDSISAILSVSIRDISFVQKDIDIIGWSLLGRDIEDSLLISSDASSLKKIDDIMLCTSTSFKRKTDTFDTSYFCLSGHVISKRKLPKEVSLIIKNEGELNSIHLPLDERGYFKDNSIIIFDSCYIALAGEANGLTLEIDTLDHTHSIEKYPLILNNFKEIGVLENNKINNNNQASIKALPILPKELAMYIGDSLKVNHKILPNVSVISRKWRSRADSLTDTYMSESMKRRFENVGLRVKDIVVDKDPMRYMYDNIIDFLKGKMIDVDIHARIFYDEMEINYETARMMTSLPTIGFIRLIGGIKPQTILIYTEKYTASNLKQQFKRKSGQSILGYNSYIPFGQSTVSKEKSAPDRRKTLFWQPGISLSKSNTIMDIQFDNNDIAKKLLIVIEGVKSDGTPIHYEKIVEN